MVNHLILVGESQNLHISDGRLISGPRKIAVETLGTVQCFAVQCHWSQTALERLSAQCPVVMARWDKQQKKWQTFSLAPRARYVNPMALLKLCRLPPQRATQLASALLWTKVCNQHEMLRMFDPRLAEKPHLRENSFNRILRLEATYARFFWPRYFSALSTDLFERERQKPRHPLNVALNYGYGFLYHAIEWQCLASGLDPCVGIIHKLRRSRPNLACDLIEPLRCAVELTVVRHLNDVQEPQRLAGHFAEMLETPFTYRSGNFKLRSIIRLMVESFIRALDGKEAFHPFVLHARDACL
jgi:CRISPR-associated endonuclease Cas1